MIKESGKSDTYFFWVTHNNWLITNRRVRDGFLLSKPKVNMTSLCSTAAPDCHTGQSNGRYLACACSTPVVVVEQGKVETAEWKLYGFMPTTLTTVVLFVVAS